MKNKLSDLSCEELREIVRYDPETGLLYWKVHISRRCRAGMEALTARETHGYRHGKIRGRACKAHRVAWALFHGYWPKNDIDHINGVRDDNRLCNLREATRSENLCNVGIRSNNTSGFKGVSLCKKTGLWSAYIRKDGARSFLGYFETPKIAHQAYCDAAMRIHGEFMKPISELTAIPTTGGA